MLGQRREENRLLAVYSTMRCQTAEGSPCKLRQHIEGSLPPTKDAVRCPQKRTNQHSERHRRVEVTTGDPATHVNHYHQHGTYGQRRQCLTSCCTHCEAQHQ